MRTGTSRRIDSRFGRNYRVIFAAVSAIGALSLPAHAQTTTLFFDNNGTGNNLGSGATGSNTWSATSLNRATKSAPGATAPGMWVPGAVANINANFGTIAVSDIESITGLNIVNGSGANTFTVSGAGPWGFNIGSTGATINQGTNSKQIIAVPIIGSGDLIVNSTVTSSPSPVNLAGTLVSFTGNIYVNDAFTGAVTAANAAQFQLDQAPGDPTKTIYLDQFAQLLNNNQNNASAAATNFPGAGTDPLTGSAGATPLLLTISNNIVLNYKGVANNTTNTIGTSNGPTYTFNGVVTNYAKVVSYAGNSIPAPAPTPA